MHNGQNWVLRIDLESFFPSINFGRVRGALLAEPFRFPPKIATVISALCTHENKLPQGAPTSPVLSNIIAHRLDGKLLALAKKYRCRVTRYADDIIFSTNQRAMPAQLAKKVASHNLAKHFAGDELSEMIAGEGFQVNQDKTHLMHQTQRQLVTGLIANEKTNIPREYVRELRASLHLWQTKGLEPAASIFFDKYYKKQRGIQKTPDSFRNVIRGRLQYIGSIKGWTSSVYLSLGKKLSSLDDSFSAPTICSSIPATDKMQVFTEGKTDRMHLKAAMRALFGSEDSAIGAQVMLVEDERIKGDTELLQILRLHAKTPHSQPFVFIFDRDNQKAIDEVTDGHHAWKDWGNRVYSFALPVPPHRKDEPRTCIELLYSDEELLVKNDDGRRLYRRTEFDEHGYHYHEKNIFIRHQKATTLIPEEVNNTEQRRNVALSKAEFAALIAERQENFANFSFEPFRPIFEILTEIRNLPQDLI